MGIKIGLWGQVSLGLKPPSTYFEHDMFLPCSITGSCFGLTTPSYLKKCHGKQRHLRRLHTDANGVVSKGADIFYLSKSILIADAGTEDRIVNVSGDALTGGMRWNNSEMAWANC